MQSVLTYRNNVGLHPTRNRTSVHRTSGALPVISVKGILHKPIHLKWNQVLQPSHSIMSSKPFGSLQKFNTAVKAGVPKLGNCLEMYTCAQACAQACIQLQCTRGGQAVASVHKECLSLYTCCAQIGHCTCVHFQAVSKLGYSSFYSSVTNNVSVQTSSQALMMVEMEIVPPSRKFSSR